MVDIVFTKRYHNSLMLLMKLSKADLVILHFITEEMNEDNFIVNSKTLKRKLNNKIKEIGKKTYEDNTINKSFRNICNAFIMKKLKARGLYQVNPLFFFRGTEEERQKLIRRELEFPNKETVNKYRHFLMLSKEHGYN